MTTVTFGGMEVHRIDETKFKPTVVEGDTDRLAAQMVKMHKKEKTPNASKQGFAPLNAAGMNGAYLENWLNTVIELSPDFKVDEATNKEFAKPLNRFFLSKMQLLDLGLDTGEIERLFKALFVHSMGFIQMIQEIGGNLDAGKRQFLQNNVWRVFCMLLEYCQPVDYSMMVKRYQKEYTDTIREKEEWIEKLETG